jgi:hypothetical protein
MSSLSGILLSCSQRRRNGSTAPLPKLLVGTCEAHHFIVSGGRRSSAYTYALRATTGGSQYARKVICRGVGCQHEAARDSRVGETIFIYHRSAHSAQSSSRYKCKCIRFQLCPTQHKQLDGGWFRQGTGARAQSVSLGGSAPGLSWN